MAKKSDTAWRGQVPMRIAFLQALYKAPRFDKQAMRAGGSALVSQGEKRRTQRPNVESTLVESIPVSTRRRRQSRRSAGSTTRSPR